MSNCEEVLDLLVVVLDVSSLPKVAKDVHDPYAKFSVDSTKEDVHQVFRQRRKRQFVERRYVE
ncbi:MAG: hypothetical protein ABI335_07990 [Polyangiaceae bacterium]